MEQHTFKTALWARWIGLSIGQVDCPYCGLHKISQRNFQVGHVIPAKLGGPRSISNCRPVCSCNQSLGANEMVVETEMGEMPELPEGRLYAWVTPRKTLALRARKAVARTQRDTPNAATAEPTASLHANDDDTRCQRCGTTFFRKTHLRRHLMKTGSCEPQVSNTDRATLLAAIAKPTTITQHACPCGKSFSTPSNQYRHQKQCETAIKNTAANCKKIPTTCIAGPNTSQTNIKKQLMMLVSLLPA